jgi:RNA polymerase sigma-70 factor (ECF subfamily)
MFMSSCIPPCGHSFDELHLLTDEELMVHLQSGHDGALAIIADRHKRLLWRVAFTILHDRDEAEDLVQSVFLELFKRASLFDPRRGTLKVWIVQLAYTLSINRFNYRKRQHFQNQVGVSDQSLPQYTSTLGLTQGEVQKLIEEALGSLNKSQRKAIELIALEGLTFQELAKRTGETVSNAKHHFYRGMIRLRKLYRTREPVAANSQNDVSRGTTAPQQQQRSDGD